MLRETLIAFRRLGLLRVAGLLALVMVVGVLWLGSLGPFLRPVLTGSGTLIIGYLVSRAVLLDQPLLCRAGGFGPLRQIGHYLLACLWVYALVLLAVLCALAVLFTAMPQTLPMVLEGNRLFIWGIGLISLGICAVFGTALPAAAIGAPYGPQAAREATRGQRWSLFAALLLGPGLLHMLKLWSVPLPLLEVQGDAVRLMPVQMPLEPVQTGIAAGLTILGFILTATILAVAWRRRQPVTPLAEVFE